MPAKSSNTTSLLAELTKNAAEFNRASDTINSLIDHFEENLRNLQLGIETWICDPPLYSQEAEVENSEGQKGGGTVDTQLGFTKRAGEWGLTVRVAVYRFDKTENQWEFLRAESETPLHDASRQVRIAAMGQFPQLLRVLNAKVREVLDKIDAARKVVEL
jgi:hypothetical protein